MNIGIIGCGFIARKRAASIAELAGELDLKIAVAADINKEAAESFAKEHGCDATTNWKNVVEDPDIDIIFVCVTNNKLAEITAAAIEQKKHVLVEKPAGRTKAEVRGLVALHEKIPTVVKVGFNHRFHPLIMEAHSMYKKGAIGDLMWIRGVYGQRARPGFDKEWRSKKSLAGGGELIDQGIHILDLAIEYLGRPDKVHSITRNSFWEMEVEDNAFLLMTNKSGNVAQLHASSTEWTNRFLFEIYGTKGALRIKGLHKNYGLQTLQILRLDPDSWEEKYFRFKKEEKQAPEEDLSWKAELREFISAIGENREPNGNLYDALETLDVVEQVYYANDNVHDNPNSKKEDI